MRLRCMHSFLARSSEEVRLHRVNLLNDWRKAPALELRILKLEISVNNPSNRTANLSY